MQETFPGKKVARLNACFAKILKKKRIELFYEDKEEHKIFLNYHQGAWRIAYFEDDRDDRELMEKVLTEPAIQETIKRQFGDLEPISKEKENERGRKRRRNTLSPFLRRRDAAGSASSLL